MTSEGVEEQEEAEFPSVTSLAEGRVAYILEWPSLEVEDGHKEALVFVVMKREAGLLLAVPDGFIPEEELGQANLAEAGGSVLGPSSVLVIPGVVAEGGVDSPTGVDMNVLVVDMDASVVGQLRVADAVEDLAMGFDAEDPFSIPSPDVLVAKSLEWLSSAGLQQLEANYTPEVTAESVAGTPKAAAPKRQRRKPAGGATASGGGVQPKRATTASLAASMETVLQTLPALTNQMQMLLSRQALEGSMKKGSSVSAVLSQPLGGSMVGGPVSTTPGEVAKIMKAPPKWGPPPKKSSVQVQHVPGARQEAEELALEKQEMGESSSLAQAMMAQSVAITNLVAQIAGSSGDPMVDLQGQSSSTRGALGRARLQQELAAHKGTFFHSVVMSMARRMAPTMPAEQPYGELQMAGISGVRYLERFGGYGKQKELGILQYNIMTAFDFLMVGNVEAAKDTIALMAVMVEQASMDHGKFDLAQVLTFQEDPPSSIFMTRAASQVSRSRAFAPLADQKWITVSLAFLKELDTITTKRSELVGGSLSTSLSTVPPPPKAKQPGSPKKKGGGRGNQRQQLEEEDVQ